jgi:hypothetical protein
MRKSVCFSHYSEGLFLLKRVLSLVLIQKTENDGASKACFLLQNIGLVFHVGVGNHAWLSKSTSKSILKLAS